ncbi:hypothetical protein HID58_034801 [Brassica napus]|uniref:Uncharacterized protein n=1 Tax=Brassica napus TaxID=3708 RepID=A0ABQ8C339_BRANA|nr:hypothetical protein HID58_034801 [Brassica napus]
MWTTTKSHTYVGGHLVHCGFN